MTWIPVLDSEEGLHRPVRGEFVVEPGEDMPLVGDGDLIELPVQPPFEGLDIPVDVDLGSSLFKFGQTNNEGT